MCVCVRACVRACVRVCACVHAHCVVLCECKGLESVLFSSILMAVTGGMTEGPAPAFSHTTTQ